MQQQAHATFGVLHRALHSRQIGGEIGCRHIHNVKILGKLGHVLSGGAVQKIGGGSFGEDQAQRYIHGLLQLAGQLGESALPGGGVAVVDELQLAGVGVMEVFQYHLFKSGGLTGLDHSNQTFQRVLAGRIEPGNIFPIQPGGTAGGVQRRAAIAGTGTGIVP